MGPGQAKVEMTCHRQPRGTKSWPPPGFSPGNPQLFTLLGMGGRVFEGPWTQDPPTMVIACPLLSVPSSSAPVTRPHPPSTHPVPTQTHHSPMPDIGKTHRSPSGGEQGSLGQESPPQQGRPHGPLSIGGGQPVAPGLHSRSGHGPLTVFGLVLGQCTLPCAAGPSSALTWDPGGGLRGSRGAWEAPGLRKVGSGAGHLPLKGALAGVPHMARGWLPKAQAFLGYGGAAWSPHGPPLPRAKTPRLHP